MQDPPEVHRESDLKKYGRKIARQVKKLGENHEPKPDFKSLRKLSINDKKMLAIRGLGISTRIANGLEDRGILFVGQLLSVSYEEILAIPNQGDKTVSQLAEILDEIGLLDLWDFGVE